MKGHSFKTDEGKEIEMRRLGLDDIDHALEIVASVVEGSANRSLLTGVPFDVSSAASIAVTFAAGMRYAKRPLREWLQTLIPQDQQAEMALPDWGAAFLAMTTHPDALSFLGYVRRIGASKFVEELKELVRPLTTDQATSPES